MKRLVVSFLLMTATSLGEPQPIAVYTVHYERGPMGRIEKIIENGEKITQFLYDKCGRLATKIKPDGTELRREYNCLGLLTRYYSKDFDYYYEYDKCGRLLSVADAVFEQTTTRKYDVYGQIIQEIIGTGLTFLFDISPYGQRQSLTLPDQSQIKYVHNGIFLHSVSRGGLTCTYAERDLNGHITRIDLPGGIGSFCIEYDPCARWKKVSSPFFSADYTVYDPVGNLCEYTFEDSLGSKTCRYEYDALDQLISENDHTYLYDSIYNRRKKDYNPYAINNLCHIESDGQHAFAYDANGNLLSDGIHNFVYDSQDRLIEIHKDNIKILYFYDPFHRRLSKRVLHRDKEIEMKLYLWDGDNEIGTCDKNGKIQELRVLGEGLGAEIGSAVLIECNGKSYAPIHDHRGCVVTLVDVKQKTTSETYRYTAFGEELTEGKLSPWRFASKRIEEETGLVFFGRRYYSPELGRWITPDPQGYDNGPNLYAYLSNSPLTDCDLYGLWSMREAWGNAQHFMWGMLEGSAYHFSNMASSFCSRDFTNPTWQPRSLLTSQDLAMPTRYLDRVEKTLLPFTYEARRMGNDTPHSDLMRARGRAWGEQAITFGGLFSAFSAGKGLLNASSRFQEMSQFPAHELSRDYLFSGRPFIFNTTSTLKGSRNHLKPNAQAEGAHSVFRRDPVTGKVSHYETFRPQINPYDPKPWESIMRFDAFGKQHLNKFYDQWIGTPHVHDPYYPGGIRPSHPWEMPK